MKLFQVNETNYISTDSVIGVTFENPNFAVVVTSIGVKHRITHEQARLLISCFEVIKPIVDVTPNSSPVLLSHYFTSTRGEQPR